MIRIENNTDRQAWERFARSHQFGNVFQDGLFYDIYIKTSSYTPLNISAIDENGEVTGILQAVIQKEKGLGLLTSRSIIHGGPLVREGDLESLDLLLKEYNQQIKGKAIYSQFRNFREWDQSEKEIFAKNGFSFEDHLDIHIPLNRPADEILNDMHQGRRKNIRRAEKLPLVFEEIKNQDDINKSLSQIENTYRRIKLPCPDRSFFLFSDEVLVKGGVLKKFGAWSERVLIACRYVLCYNKMIYDWYAGAEDNHLDKYPNDFLPWKVMEWGSKNGYSLFDFGGAGKPSVPYGVRDYKLKFGGTLVNFGRFEKIHNSSLFTIGKVGLSLYKTFKRN